MKKITEKNKFKKFLLVIKIVGHFNLIEFNSTKLYCSMLTACKHTHGDKTFWRVHFYRTKKIFF